MAKEKSSIDICGLLVQVEHNQAQKVQNILTTIAGVEVHGLSEDNRFVVTIEQDSQAKIMRAVDFINQTKNVISTSLVYQHSEQI